MSKNYLKATSSSLAKYRNPINVREKIHGLSEALNELKQDIRFEVTSNEALTKVQRESYETVHNQVNVLRSGFMELADAVMEELEGTKSDVRNEVREHIGDVSRRVSEVEDRQRATEDAFGQLSVGLTSSTQQTLQHLQIMKENQDNMWKELFELKGENEDERKLGELEREMQGLYQTIEELKKNVQETYENIGKLMGVKGEIKKERVKWKSRYIDVKSVVELLERRVRDLETREKPYEQTNHYKPFDRSEMVQRVSEGFSYSLDAFKQEIQSKIVSIESLVKSKEPSVAVHNENSVFEERLTYLEELTVTQRKELFSLLSVTEQKAAKNYDKLVRTIYQLARHQDLPEAILAL